MGVTIFSKKAVEFHHPKDYDTKHTVLAMDFSPVPEWVLDSDMFALLKKEGSVRVIESARDLKDVETTGLKAKQKIAAVADEIPEDDNEEEAENTEAADSVDYASMKAKQLYELCIEKGIEVEPKQDKNVYLEAILEADRMQAE